MEFRVNDRVRRINGSHQGMTIGDTATIREVEDRTIYLEEYRYGYDPNNFELIERAETVLENYEIY